MTVAVRDKVNGTKRMIRKSEPSRTSRPSINSRIQFENLITTISTQFINLAPEDLDKGIKEALKKIFMTSSSLSS